jgi:hypothetical protein
MSNLELVELALPNWHVIEEFSSPNFFRRLVRNCNTSLHYMINIYLLYMGRVFKEVGDKMLHLIGMWSKITLLEFSRRLVTSVL